MRRALYTVVRISYTSRGPTHKSRNASNKYPAMQHFVTEKCTRAHFCYKMVQRELDASALWDLSDGNILYGCDYLSTS